MKRTGKTIFIIMICIFLINGFYSTDTFASTYAFDEFYNPDNDAWANTSRVSMDGKKTLSIPKESIKTIDLIVSGTDDPKVKTMKDEDGNEIQFSRIDGDNKTYSIYECTPESASKIKIQLKKCQYESVMLYTIYHSSIVAKYSIVEQIGNPDSKLYQAAIRFYKGESVQKITNSEIRYTVEKNSWSTLASPTSAKDDCYLGEPGLDESSVNALADDYSMHITFTDENGTVVLADAQKADKKEFKDIIKKYKPTLYKRFLAKSDQERKNIIFSIVLGIGVCIAILAFMLIYKPWKRNKENLLEKKDKLYADIIKLRSELREIWSIYCSDLEILQVVEGLEEYAPWMTTFLLYTEQYKKYSAEETNNALSSVKDQMEKNIQKLQEEQKANKLPKLNVLKDILNQCEERMKMIRSITSYIHAVAEEITLAKQEITEYECRKMFIDLTMELIDHKDDVYKMTIYKKKLGQTQEQGILKINEQEFIAKGYPKLDQFDVHGLILGMGFTSDHSRQNPVLISNRPLCCKNSEDFDQLEHPSKLGPYQYEISNGMLLYDANNQSILYRFTINRS
jgi:hypothetical protein